MTEGRHQQETQDYSKSRYTSQPSLKRKCRKRKEERERGSACERRKGGCGEIVGGEFEVDGRVPLHCCCINKKGCFLPVKGEISKVRRREKVVSPWAVEGRGERSGKGPSFVLIRLLFPSFHFPPPPSTSPFSHTLSLLCYFLYCCGGIHSHSHIFSPPS